MRCVIIPLALVIGGACVMYAIYEFNEYLATVRKLRLDALKREFTFKKEKEQ